MNFWHHQVAGVEGVEAAVAAGWHRVCLTSPTGMGKTAIVAELVRRDLAAGRTAILYTNRRLLLEQATTVFGEFGLDPGVRATGYCPETHKPFQIASVQTEAARGGGKLPGWAEFPADRVYFDEGHLMTGEQAVGVALAHRNMRDRCVVVYVTATPLGMAQVADTMVVAGTTSEGRACGALVPAHHYGPSEPYIPRKDQAALEREELSEKKIRKLIMRPGIYGFVLDHLRRLNPDLRPTILFAPGVDESRWFAQEFAKVGISSAHIDGDFVWINGREYAADRAARDAALEGSKDGSVRVLCNRFVLREGIDAPWLAHGIFATIFGSLQSYLQSGGRLLRAFPGLGAVTVQDHGGNWHRHGGLNADRQWDLTLPAHAASGMRLDAFRDPNVGDDDPPKEPFLCPECTRILTVRKCPCGFNVDPARKTRPVMQESGELKWQAGDVYVKKQRKDVRTATRDWCICYFRARNCGFTFRQAEALFFRDFHYWPLKNLKFMPKTARGWYLKVKDVPFSELYS